MRIKMLQNYIMKKTALRNELAQISKYDGYVDEGYEDRFLEIHDKLNKIDTLLLDYKDKKTKLITDAIIKDSENRTLSPQQRVFFKDSKITNENNELCVLYHSTPEDFNEFDFGKVGQNTRAKNTVLGAFFSGSKSFTDQFGDKTKEVYLNITNPYELPNEYSTDVEIIEYLKMTGQENKIKPLQKIT